CPGWQQVQIAIPGGMDAIEPVLRSGRDHLAQSGGGWRTQIASQRGAPEVGLDQEYWRAGQLAHGGAEKSRQAADGIRTLDRTNPDCKAFAGMFGGEKLVGQIHKLGLIAKVNGGRPGERDLFDPGWHICRSSDPLGGREEVPCPVSFL